MIVQTLSRAVRVALLASIGFGLAAAVHAQQAAPSAGAITAAKEIIAIKKGANNTFEMIIPGLIEQTRSAIAQSLVGQGKPTLVKDLDDISLQLASEFGPRLNKLFDEIAVIYARHFTEQELKDALTFYKSPLGRKIVVEEGKILDETNQHAHEWAKTLPDDILNRFRAELKKKGYDF